MMQDQQEVRCPQCNRLLFKVIYNVIGDLRLEIVCPKSKCGELVVWPVLVPEIGERRQLATNSEFETSPLR